MSEDNNKNVGSIEEAIKQLEDLKLDRLSFVIGDKEHDKIYLKDIQAIEIVLGNLEALCDMQREADRELKRQKQINEKLKNKLLDTIKGTKIIKEETPEYIKENYISKQKIKNKIEEYEELVEDFEKTDNSGRFKKQNSIDYYKLEAFKELLQESEDK